MFPLTNIRSLRSNSRSFRTMVAMFSGVVAQFSLAECCSIGRQWQSSRCKYRSAGQSVCRRTANADQHFLRSGPRQTCLQFPGILTSHNPSHGALSHCTRLCRFAKAGVPIPKQLGKLLVFLSKIYEKHGKLRVREIEDNPWKEPPEAVVKKGMPAVWEYFVDLFAEGVAPVPRRMIKVVLVGQEGAGKTR